jgi:hypothetical protein
MVITLPLCVLYGSQNKQKVKQAEAWSGPEGYRTLRFPDFLKKAQDGGKIVSLTHRQHVLYKEVKVKQSRYRQWGGPEGYRKLRFPDFLTTAQDGGKVVSLKHRPHLPPGNTPGTHFC